MAKGKIWIEALHRSAAKWPLGGADEVVVDSDGKLELVKSGRGTKFTEEACAVNVADQASAKYPQMVISIFEEV